MLNLQVIGAGAAGNKAAINLIKKGFNPKNVILLNSTAKDIDPEYQDNAIIFGTHSNSLGGCGKERERGKKLILRDLVTGNVKLDSVIDLPHAVVIVSSTEGGSGSAITPIIADYIKDVMGIPVIVCLFFGFNQDARGMQNSIEICQELSEDIGVIGISNHKFLEECSNNKFKAEEKANDLFVELINILSGNGLKPSRQNIDDTDLLKIITTPGYMCIGSAPVFKVKNIDQYNKIINDAIDNSKLVDTSKKGAKRIGAIFDIDEFLSDNVDFSSETFLEEFGTPYEMYTHVQDSGVNTVTWIASGMPMPTEEVKAIYEEYLKRSEAVNKKVDSFFEEIAQLKGNQEDGMFNMLDNKPIGTKERDKFFEEFGLDVKPKKSVKSSAKNEY